MNMTVMYIQNTGLRVRRIFRRLP